MLTKQTTKFKSVKIKKMFHPSYFHSENSRIRGQTNSVGLDEATHYEPHYQNSRYLQIQLVLSVNDNGNMC